MQHDETYYRRRCEFLDAEITALKVENERLEADLEKESLAGYSDDEESCCNELVQSLEFTNMALAMQWAWERLEEGFYVRMFRR